MSHKVCILVIIKCKNLYWFFPATDCHAPIMTQGLTIKVITGLFKCFLSEALVSSTSNQDISHDFKEHYIVIAYVCLTKRLYSLVEWCHDLYNFRLHL